ncbi:hypothetical protein SBRCBS47491_003856 [Sporothrix bragantina]|uniref:Uncharacterized protein n=1 Tax=Sporothrix bragantina TaxID=671064 RepID=A0ABP0BIL4_9PEZI
MDFHGSRSGSPTPLQVVSPERVNQQQGNHLGFDSSIASVTDKISQFNSLAMQSKQLERKTADAALKRAMLGREEAETEMRRYREEARQLRKQADEGRHREQRVGERLEAVMVGENYGRAKETHAHTQALWEKEIRRARKETFKSQSAIVKLQEELKAARATARASEEALVHEKERSKAREQEAFQARYELVGCQEELEQTLQKVKILEQERDAFRSLAKSEEDVARIASEGRLPLPPPDPEEEAEEVQLKEKEEADEMEEDTPRSDDDSMVEDDDAADTLLAIPKQRWGKQKSTRTARVSSAALLEIKSSAASEAEISELTRLWQWEKQRADRASDLVEYLEAECHLRACSCMKKRPRTSILESARKRPNLDIGDSGDRIILSEMATIASPTAKIRANFAPTPKKAQPSSVDVNHSPEHQHDEKEEAEEVTEEQRDRKEHNQSPKQKPPRLSTTVFVPSEGVFRTVSQQIAEEMEEAVAAAAVATMAAMPEEPVEVVEEVVEEAAEEVRAATLDVAEPTAEPTQQHTFTHTHTHTMIPHHEILDEEIQDADTTLGDMTTDTADYTVELTSDQSMYARTPSVDPPSFAQQRTSLLSLLDAPHRQEAEQPINFYVPTTSAPEILASASARDITDIRDFDVCSNADMDISMEEMAPRAAASILISSTSMRDVVTETEPVTETQVTRHDAVAETEQEDSRVSDVTEVAYSRISQPGHGRSASAQVSQNNKDDCDNDHDATAQAQPQRYETPVMDEAPSTRSVRPHTVAATNVFSHKTTTTKVPLREETTDPSLAQRIMAAQRTPTNRILPTSASASAIYGDGEAKAADGPSFDINNPALTPTMTREECLAQIRERRGRARSAAGGSTSSSSSAGTATTAPGGIRRPVTPGKERREVSAPVRRVASVRRVRP